MTAFMAGISGADDVTQVAEADDEGADVVFSESAAGLAADLVPLENRIRLVTCKSLSLRQRANIR